MLKRLCVLAVLMVLLAPAESLAQPARGESDAVRVLMQGAGAKDSSGLGLAPNDCPSGPTPRLIQRAIGRGVGQSPAWVLGMSGTHLTLDYGSGTRFLDYQPNYGWGHSVQIVADSRYHGQITISGSGIHGEGALAFVDQRLARITRSLVLDPWHSWGFAGLDRTWSYFPSTLYVPRAGCYYLTAHWHGGSWRIPFAAGRTQNSTH